MRRQREAVSIPGPYPALKGRAKFTRRYAANAGIACERFCV